MGKLRAKGFTLVECLVALAILGITSLLLAQAYTAVLKLSANTSKLNYSLNQQMADAELKENADDITASGSSLTMYMSVDGSGNSVSQSSTDNYTIDTGVYLIKAYTVDNSGNNVAIEKGSAYESDGSGSDVRYIYFVRKS